MRKQKWNHCLIRKNIICVCKKWLLHAKGMQETYGYGGGEMDDFIEEGFIYVSAGARSRNLGAIGKAPAPVVDLKAGIITLRENEDVLPGDTDKIISTGGSGAGEMSTMLGASGNMEEYYSYLYEIKAPGVTYDASTDTYASEYKVICSIDHLGDIVSII